MELTDLLEIHNYNCKHKSAEEEEDLVVQADVVCVVLLLLVELTIFQVGL